jgi:hypothetical protein
VLVGRLKVYRDRFKRNQGFSALLKDWNSIWLSLREIEKGGNDLFSNRGRFIKYIARNNTWKKLDIETKKEIINKVNNIDSDRKNILIRFLCTH